MDNKLAVSYYELLKLFSLVENPPLLLLGSEAESFLDDYIKFNPDRESSLRNVNGVFLYENLNMEYFMKKGFSKDYLISGVICLFNERIETLVHEMVHAKQHNDRDCFLYLKDNSDYEFLYKKIYVYYPCEEEAYNFTLSYLKDKKLMIKYLSYLIHYNNLKINYLFNYLRYKSLLFNYLRKSV